MGGKGRTQGRRSMSCEEEGKASRGKDGIKDAQEVMMLIHSDPWRLLPMSLSERSGTAEASCGAVNEET